MKPVLGHLSDVAGPLPMLKRTALGRALIVIPLLGIICADTTHVTVAIDEPCVAQWAPQHRWRYGRRRGRVAVQRVACVKRSRRSTSHNWRP